MVAWLACVLLSYFQLSIACRLAMGPGSVAMLLATGEKERDEIFAASANP